MDCGLGSDESIKAPHKSRTPDVSGVEGVLHLITLYLDEVGVLQSILPLHVSGWCHLIGRLLPNYHQSLRWPRINLSFPVNTANVQAAPPPRPVRARMLGAE